MQSQNGELPSGYVRCKYLESTRKQYINTKIKSSDLFTVSIDFRMTAPMIGVLQEWVFGEWSYSKAAALIGLYDNKFYVYYGQDNTNCYFQPFHNCDNFRHKIGWTKEKYIFDDYESTTKPNFCAPFLNNNVYIFSRGGTQVNAACCIYSCIIGNDDKSKNRNYIPSLDQSGRPCMYDTVTKQPFYNQGTGEFGYELLDGTYVTPI